MRFSIGLVFVFVCCTFLGCTAKDDQGAGDTSSQTAASDADASAAAGDASDVVAEADPCADLPAEMTCCPGKTNGCVPGNAYQVLVCAEDGTGYIPKACESSGGSQSVCLADECTECIPNEKRCRDDDTVERCNELGMDWEVSDSCNGESTGRICDKGSCIKACDVAGKLYTYIGCDYWAVDLDNAFVPGGRTGFYDAQGAQFSVVVSNPDVRRSATVEISTIHGEVLEDSQGAQLDLSPIEAGGLRVFNLPRRDVNGTIIAPLAYRLHSSIPITAYQFNPLENVGVFSNDASLLLPENVLGKYHIVMTREQTFEKPALRGYFTVIAVRSGETQVAVTVTAHTLASNEKDGGGNPVVPAMEPGDSKTFILQQFDVLNIETNAIGADLTGSLVISDRDVAVFGGSEASNAPNSNHCNFQYGVCQWELDKGKPINQATPCQTHEDCKDFITCCADHLEQQIYPVRTWGKHYIAAKSYDRNLELDVWRILAAEDGTVVTTFPPQANIPVLNRGQWYEFETRDHFEILADKPILVGQFLAAEQAPDPNVSGIPGVGDAGIGDPAFILSVPVAQYRKDYVFLAPNKYQADYVNIVAPVGAAVELDGEVLDDAYFESITPDYRVVRRQVEDGVHRVVADMPVGVVVYGYDQYVSYGYPAGLDLRDLNLLNENF